MKGKLKRARRQLNFQLVHDQYYYLVQCQDRFLIPERLRKSSRSDEVDVYTSYGWMKGVIISKNSMYNN